MNFFATLAGLALGAGIVVYSGNALAQDKDSYPNKPVRLIVPFPAGQATDIIARLIGERLSRAWNQPVYVDNKGGGASIPGMLAGKEAAPDGYTITFASSTTTAVNEAVIPNLPYKMERDFVPVGPVFTQTWLVVANPSAPYGSFPELVAAARKDPGSISWGFGANALELAAELVKQSAQINIRGIPYKGSGATVNDLLGGHIMLGVETMASTLPHIQSGKLKVLASLSDKRSPVLPDVPTLAELGYPGFVAAGWAGFFMPSGTPPAIVKKASDDVHAALSDPDTQKAITARGSTPDLRSLADWSAFVRSETAKWPEVIRKGNLQMGQ